MTIKAPFASASIQGCGARACRDLSGTASGIGGADVPCSLRSAPAGPPRGRRCLLPISWGRGQARRGERGRRSRRCRRTLEGPQKRTARANECRWQRTAKATPVAYSHGPPRIVAYEKVIGCSRVLLLICVCFSQLNHSESGVFLPAVNSLARPDASEARTYHAL